MKKLLKRKKVKELFRPEISLPEGELKDKMLRARIRAIPQFRIGKYIVDFALPDYLLAIEYDGQIHLENSVYDYKRHKEIEKMGWHILRIMNKKRFYVVMFDFQEIGITKYQNNAMELAISEIESFIEKEKRKDPNWMVNFSIGKQEEDNRKFYSIQELLSSKPPIK